MLTVTKKFSFEYAHKLPSYRGKCAQMHGHSGILEVTITRIKGYSDYVARKMVMNTYQTMIMDFGDLKNIVQNEIIYKYDHTYINNFLEVPTAESMLVDMHERLKGKFSLFGCRLYKLRLWETADSFATLVIPEEEWDPSMEKGRDK